MKKLFYLANLLTLSLVLSVSSARAQAPTITVNPVSDTVCDGAPAMFYAFSADTSVHYAWEVFSSIWDSVHDDAVYSGANTDTIRFTATAAMNGYFYRVRAYNGAGISAYTPFVPLVVKSVGTISGLSTVCVSSTTTVTTSGAGGTWMTTNGNASISVAGVVSGVSAGIDTILYVGDPACGADTAWHIINVLPVTISATISGASGFCVSGSDALTASVPGGTWSTTTGNASVSSLGVVTGVSRGVDTVNYVITGACGTTTAIHPVMVDTAIAASTITGATVMCATSTLALSATIAGGTWSATNARATVSSTGLVTGVTSGMDTIMYVNSNACNSTSAAHVITLEAPVATLAVTGSTGVCVSGTTTLTASVTGGSWTTTTGNATVASTGVVTGATRGIDTVNYAVTNSCGTNNYRFEIMVDTAIAASTISGGTAVCASSTLTLAATISGGTWSVSNAHASITSAGVVTGVTGGLDTIMYVNSNACNTQTATQVISVEVPVTTGSITGPSSVCTGSNITLSVPAAGGTWSFSNGNATITSIGVVSGVSVGLDTVSYSVTNACGVSSSTAVITVNTTLPHATLSGSSAVCSSSSISILSTLAGGSWSATNGNATVSTSGVVTGVTAGVDTIIYTTVGACNTDVAMKVVTVEAALSAGTVSGPSSVCAGYGVTFTGSATGGAWFSSNTAVAVVDASGVVTGRSVGTTVISYAVSNSCGTVVSTDTIDVFRTASMIVGSDSVGIGFTTTLTDSAAGGSWSSSDTLIATVSSAGVVHGLDTGTAVITYMVTNICGTSWATKTIAVGPHASAGVIYGPDSTCVGTSFAIMFADTLAPGGTWSVTNGNGTISSTGSFTGIVGGTIDTVVYTVTNGFGTSTAMKSVIISATPPVVRAWCADSATLSVGSAAHLLHGEPAGGTFTSSNPSKVAFTTSTGHFVILGKGITNLIYTYTNACGTASDTFVVNLPTSVNGINDDNNTQLSVFPNPNSGTFSLNLLSAINEQAHIIVTNMVGQTVKEFNVATNKANEITLNQPAGLYMINAITNNGRYVVKVTVTE